MNIILKKYYTNSYMRDWRKNNPEKSKVYIKRWRQNNSEKYNNYLKKYYKKNKTTIKEKRRANRGRNHELLEKDRIRSAKKRSVKKIYNMILEFNKTILKG